MFVQNIDQIFLEGEGIADDPHGVFADVLVVSIKAGEYESEGVCVRRKLLDGLVEQHGKFEECFEGELVLLLDEGPEVHVGHFVLVYMVGQHPQLLAIPLHY